LGTHAKAWLSHHRIYRPSFKKPDDLPTLAFGELPSTGLRIAAKTLALKVMALPDPAAKTRREAVLAMLAQEPGLQHAITSHDELEPGAVILTLVVWDKATCELRIPKDKYDGLALLESIEKLTGGGHAKA
jgi:hypothetical protein